MPSTLHGPVCTPQPLNELTALAPRVLQVDVVTCTFGLMFMPDYHAALRHFARVLKPGGMVAIMVWGPAEKVPFMQLQRQCFDYLAQLVPSASGSAAGSATVAPDPLAVGKPDRFGDPTPLVEGLQQAGLTEVKAEGIEVTVPYNPEMMEQLSLAMSPVGGAIKALAVSSKPGIMDDIRQHLETIVQAKGYLQQDADMASIPGNLVNLVTARKAG